MDASARAADFCNTIEQINLQQPATFCVLSEHTFSYRRKICRHVEYSHQRYSRPHRQPSDHSGESSISNFEDNLSRYGLLRKLSMSTSIQKQEPVYPAMRIAFIYSPGNCKQFGFTLSKYKNMTAGSSHQCLAESAVSLDKWHVPVLLRYGRESHVLPVNCNVNLNKALLISVHPVMLPSTLGLELDSTMRMLPLSQTTSALDPQHVWNQCELMQIQRLYFCVEISMTTTHHREVRKVRDVGVRGDSQPKPDYIEQRQPHVCPSKCLV